MERTEMSKLKPGILCFLVGPKVWPFNKNKIVRLIRLRNHPERGVLWECLNMQPLQTGQKGLIRPAGTIGHARPQSLRPIDPDGTVTQDEVKELYLPTETKEKVHG